MAKHKRKVDAALEARLAGFVTPNPVNGMKCQRPGSQNRKKGYGQHGGRR